MKKNISILLVTAVCVISMILIAGCQEENTPAQERKVKLENFELKNTIKQKDAEIKELKGQLADSEKARDRLQAGADKEIMGALEELAASAQATTPEVEQLRKENQALREMLKLLQEK